MQGWPLWFFDNPEQRARYEAWVNEAPADRNARVVLLRPEPQKEERRPSGASRMTHDEAMEALRSAQIRDKRIVSATPEEQAELRRRITWGLSGNTTDQFRADLKRN